MTIKRQETHEEQEKNISDQEMKVTTRSQSTFRRHFAELLAKAVVDVVFLPLHFPLPTVVSRSDRLIPFVASAPPPGSLTLMSECSTEKDCSSMDDCEELIRKLLSSAEVSAGELSRLHSIIDGLLNTISSSDREEMSLTSAELTILDSSGTDARRRLISRVSGTERGRRRPNVGLRLIMSSSFDDAGDG